MKRRSFITLLSVKLDGVKQQDLVITLEDEPTVTVDNIEVAQFIYLLLHNEKISVRRRVGRAAEAAA